MTGYINNNARAFAEAEVGLVGMGYSVCNPVKTSDWLGEMEHSDYLRFDFERVLEADFLVALPGWERSLGSISEILMAVRMGVKVWRWENFEEYDRVTYSDVEAAISDLHLGNTSPTSIISAGQAQTQTNERKEDNVPTEAYPFPDTTGYSG